MKSKLVTDTHVFFIKSYLSQWWKCNFKETLYMHDIKEFVNYEFNCAEQYMMARKALLFSDFDSFAKIMASKEASEQKEVGRGIGNFDQNVWNASKYSIVLRGNLLKFGQNPDLMDMLENDGFCHSIDSNCNTVINGRKFVECNANDAVWGIGLGIRSQDIFDETKWQGENLLGKVLNQVLEELS